MKKDPYCNVADQFCLAACNLEDIDPVKTCYACGLSVCLNCSLLVSYNRHRCRLCHDCICDVDKNDNRVMQHLEQIAGITCKPSYSL